MLELYEQTKDGSGTTGASSRRSKGQPATSKAGVGSKSKTSGHPSTPSLADRAAQASLTSAASMQAGAGAGEAQRVGWAHETQGEIARGDAQGVGAAARAAEPSGGASDKAPDKAAGAGVATGLPPKPGQNGHAPHDSALLDAAHGVPKSSGETEDRKLGQEGAIMSDVSAQDGVLAAALSTRSLQKVEDVGRAGIAEVQLGAGAVQAGPQQQGWEGSAFLTGEALDEAMDMDLEDEGPPGARREAGRAPLARDPPGGGRLIFRNLAAR